MIIDGNVDRDFVATARARRRRGLRRRRGHHRHGRAATALGDRRIEGDSRERHPALPIVWGGAFPTVCPDAALNAPYVDYAVRGQGEDTFAELLDALARAARRRWHRSPDSRWRSDGAVVHNPDRKFSAASLARMLPYEQAANTRGNI